MHETREQDEDREATRARGAGAEDEASAGGNRGQTVNRPGRGVAAGQGDAVRDMMGGPPPQGDVPDAPATQIAAADHEEGQGPRVRHVANAVPGQPDGEVDTRS